MFNSLRDYSEKENYIFRIFRIFHQPNSSISMRPIRAWTRRVGQFGTPGSALKMINILWPAFHFNLANYISQDPRPRYIVRAFTGGRHQLQLNRNMTKVNAPREQGRAQRATGRTLRVPINGARVRSRRRQLPPVERSLHCLRILSDWLPVCRGHNERSPRPLCTGQPRTGNAWSSHPMSKRRSMRGIGRRFMRKTDRRIDRYIDR